MEQKKIVGTTPRHPDVSPTKNTRLFLPSVLGWLAEPQLGLNAAIFARLRFQLRRGSLRSLLRFERRLVGTTGFEPVKTAVTTSDK